MVGKVAAGEAAEQLAEAADSLLDYLCGCKYPVGVDHYLRVQRLLVSLAARGRVPMHARELQLWVRPLICQSDREQEKFGRDFEDWRRARGQAETDYVPPHEPVQETPREVKRGWSRWLIGSGIVVLVVAAALGFWIAGKSGVQPQTPHPVATGYGVGWVSILVGAVVLAAIIAAVLRRRSRTNAAQRPAVPEYLLIDQGSSADLFARFAGGMVQRFEDSNVAINQFYFDRNPYQCYPKRGYRPVTIRELSERFPEHRLLVFSDGAGFVSPVANQYAPWMESLANWGTKTLLTPNARAYWGVRESIIAKAGWTVIPAEQEEVVALAHKMTRLPIIGKLAARIATRGTRRRILKDKPLNARQLFEAARPYSARKVIMGSTRVARRAGIQLAAPAVVASSSATPPRINGSVG